MLGARHPELAYFVTYARFWELGLGGVLALAAVPHPSPRAGEAMRVAGIAGIVAAFLFHRPDSPFPAFAALFSTFGTVLVIAAGPRPPGLSIGRILDSRPALYLGDISYSAYLWHWPLIVFVLVLQRGAMPPVSAVAIIVATLLLSHATKVLVEDPFRRGRGAPLRTIGYGLAAIAAASAVPAVIVAIIAEPFGTAGLSVDDPRYPGAAALFGAAVPEVDAPIPPLAKLKADVPSAYYGDRCHLPSEATEPHPCHLGNPDGRFHVVLIGDSQAAQWMPAIEKIAQDHGWQVTTHTKSACPVLREAGYWRKNRYDQCVKWGNSVLALLKASPPDLVIASQETALGLYRESGRSTPKDMAAAIGEVWKEIEAMGVPIAEIRDTPSIPFDPGECLATGDPCVADRAKIMARTEPILLAAAADPAVAVIDMTGGICTDTGCPAVIGNVIVWRDSGHLSATYVRSLANFLYLRLRQSVPAVASAPDGPEPAVEAKHPDEKPAGHKAKKHRRN